MLYVNCVSAGLVVHVVEGSEVFSKTLCPITSLHVWKVYSSRLSTVTLVHATRQTDGTVSSRCLGVLFWSDNICLILLSSDGNVIIIIVYGDSGVDRVKPIVPRKCDVIECDCFSRSSVCAANMRPIVVSERVDGADSRRPRRVCYVNVQIASTTFISNRLWFFVAVRDSLVVICSVCCGVRLITISSGVRGSCYCFLGGAFAESGRGG